jgi:hypothetical protein
MHGSCEYTCYQAAKNRCNNPNNKDFGNYGERGIKFLYESFEEFFADLGPRPPGLTVDRIDNNGHYEPGNCRWTTQLVQQNNRRGNRPVTIGERTRSVADWAREFSINPDMARNRLRRGWSIEAALTRNPQTGRRRKLTPNLVRAIRADFHSGLKNKAGLGRKYGASPAAISDLLTGRTHRHVT